MVDFDRHRRKSDGPADRRRSRSPRDRPAGGRQTEAARMTDPLTMEQHVSFDYFCNWYQSLNPNAPIDAAMQIRYGDYEHDLLARTAKAFVDVQINTAWFQDTYDGIDHGMSHKRQAYSQFKQDLQSNSYKSFALPIAQEGIGFDMSRDQQLMLNNTGDIMTQVLTLRNIPSVVSRAKLEEDLGARTSAVEHLSISAARLHDLVRTAWITLRGDANSTEIRAQLHGATLEEEGKTLHAFDVAHYRRPAADARTRTLWAQLNEPDRLQPHLSNLESIIQQFDSVLSLDSLWSKILSTKESDVMGQVDVAVEYLRVVHYFDYWNLKQYDSAMDIQTHVPTYSRLAPGVISSQRAFDIWQVKFNQKLQLILHADSELARMRVKPVEEVVAEHIIAAVQQEDEGRFRCHVMECRKLFQDLPFVQKHIEKRHGEWIQQITNRELLFQRYMRDANKLLPYKQYREPRNNRHQSSPTRNRRRSPRGGPRHAGHVSGRPGRNEGMQNYRDLDKPAEELPELDY